VGPRGSSRAVRGQCRKGVVDSSTTGATAMRQTMVCWTGLVEGCTVSAEHKRANPIARHAGWPARAQRSGGSK